MTVYRTCYGCTLRGKPCERRDTLAASIKGLGLQSVKHKCDARTPIFPIGAPVWLNTVYNIHGDSDENGIPMDDFPGHVVGHSGSKVIVYVKPGSLGYDDETGELPFVSQNNGFCKVAIKRIRARDGEVEPVCPDCMLPASMGHMENYPCDPKLVAEMWRLAEAH